MAPSTTARSALLMRPGEPSGLASVTIRAIRPVTRRVCSITGFWADASPVPLMVVAGGRSSGLMTASGLALMRRFCPPSARTRRRLSPFIGSAMSTSGGSGRVRCRQTQVPTVTVFPPPGGETMQSIGAFQPSARA